MFKKLQIENMTWLELEKTFSQDNFFALINVTFKLLFSIELLRFTSIDAFLVIVFFSATQMHFFTLIILCV